MSTTCGCTTPCAKATRPSSKFAGQGAHGCPGNPVSAPIRAMLRHAAQSPLKDAVIMLKLQVSNTTGRLRTNSLATALACKKGVFKAWGAGSSGVSFRTRSSGSAKHASQRNGVAWWVWNSHTTYIKQGMNSYGNQWVSKMCRPWLRGSAQHACLGCRRRTRAPQTSGGGRGPRSIMLGRFRGPMCFQTHNHKRVRRGLRRQTSRRPGSSGSGHRAGGGCRRGMHGA